MKVETIIAEDSPAPIGPYSHIAKSGQFISISATAGFDPVSGEMVGPDIDSQVRQIIRLLQAMLESVGSDLAHVVHVNVFLKDMQHFDALNRAYAEAMGEHRPARTVIGVTDLPKAGSLVTMNLTAVTKD